jgi:hypothetical protein
MQDSWDVKTINMIREKLCYRDYRVGINDSGTLVKLWFIDRDFSEYLVDLKVALRVPLYDEFRYDMFYI